MKKIFLMLTLLLVMILSFQVTESNAQAKTMLSEYGSATDTVTNTGVGFLSVSIPGNAERVSFQVVVTEISGTIAGTITVQGSLDGTNYKAIPTLDTQTSITTATALDVASQVFVWRLSAHSFPYYRISHTGTGTMAATIAGKAWATR